MSILFPGDSFLYSLLKDVGRSLSRVRARRLLRPEVFRRWTVDEWYDLHDAFERFGDPAHLSFRTQASETFEELFQEQKAVALPLDHEEHKVMTEHLNDAQHRIDYYEMLLGNDLRERLLRGELIARAYREPFEPGAPYETISRHEWRVLELTLPDRAERRAKATSEWQSASPAQNRSFAVNDETLPRPTNDARQRRRGPGPACRLVQRMWSPE